jgi:hypothetical protein
MPGATVSAGAVSGQIVKSKITTRYVFNIVDIKPSEDDINTTVAASIDDSLAVSYLSSYKVVAVMYPRQSRGAPNVQS